MEARVLAASIASRTAYQKVATLGGADSFTELARQVWKRISAYYEADSEVPCVDIDLLRAKLHRDFPNHMDKFDALLDNLPQVSPPNIVEYVKDAKLSCLALEVCAALDKADTAKSVDLMREYVSIYDVGFAESTTNDDLFTVMQGVKTEALTQKLSSGGKYKLYPPGLGKIVYDLMPGDHILIFAAPETGKSATAITMACGLANAGLRVLYIGNEDPADRMVMRMKACLSRMPVEILKQRPADADARASRAGFDNIIFKELSPGSTDDIKRLCLHFKPDVCVVDQILNLHISGMKDPGTTEKLEAISKVLRQLYKQTGILGISISQADQKAIGKLMLEIDNVYYSNIGVQGQADVMIGVGMDKNYESKGLRWLNVVKNKASGLHAGCRVKLNWPISKLEDS